MTGDIRHHTPHFRLSTHDDPEIPGPIATDAQLREDFRRARALPSEGPRHVQKSCRDSPMRCRKDSAEMTAWINSCLYLTYIENFQFQEIVSPNFEIISSDAWLSLKCPIVDYCCAMHPQGMRSGIVTRDIFRPRMTAGPAHHILFTIPVKTGVKPLGHPQEFPPRCHNIPQGCQSCFCRIRRVAGG